MMPIIIINFKSYRESVGKNAVKLAKICDNVAKKTEAKIMVAVQPADINPISRAVSIPVFAQHADIGYGKFTGSSVAQAIKDAGAKGTLLNHAERKIVDILGDSIKECNNIGLETCVCAADMNEARIAMQFEPDYIAYEIPELIGSGKSITQASPESVREFSKLLKGKKTTPLCGAGVSKHEDLKAAISLGMKGVLLASGITLAKDPEKALEELIG